MRSVFAALALIICLAAAPARAQELEAPGHSRFGLVLDAGFPEGASLSAVFRPIPEVRLWAGPAYNRLAAGIQGGATIVPWHLGISPILSLEAGRYFSADASFLANDESGVPGELAPLLRDLRYSYAAAHVGLEIGTRDGLALSLRAGLAYVSLQARGTTTTTHDEGGSSVTVTFGDPSLRGVVPSVKLALQLWF
jgi:hypothetical protein